MRVIYDIAVLGNGFYAERARTGIFRVIENLAFELANEQVIFQFSSGPKLEDYFSCANYWMENRHFQAVPLAKPSINIYALRFFHYLHELIHKRAKKNLLIRILNRGAIKFASRTFARNLLDHDVLERADIYHSPFYPFSTQIKNLKRLKKVVTVYDLIPLLYPQFFQGSGMKETILKVLDSIDENTWVTCISHATKKDLCEYLPNLDPSRVFVTHLAASSMFFPCVDESRIKNVKTKLGIPKGPYVLSLSTLEPRKNIAQTIRCFSRLVEKAEINDLLLVLVGTKGWNFESIFDEIAASPAIRERIIVTGYVADEDLAPLYSGAMMFVYPSFYEGFGLPPLEAMQCGVPVITSNTSSLPEVVGDAGITIDPRDDQGLCKAMLKIYTSAEVRQKMSLASLAQAKKFSWEKCAQQTMAAYRAATAKGISIKKI